MAESQGRKITVEELIPDGKGRGDLSLERADKCIAVEISVITGDIWEVRNIENALLSVTIPS